MPPSGAAGDLDAAAAAAYQLLQARQPAEAVARLEALIDDAAERPALQARLHAWSAQAHLALYDPSAARRHLSRALRIARSQGDADALEALQPLQQMVFAALTARAAPGPELPDTPAARAVAAYDAGDPVEGARLALEARATAQQSGDAKEEVVALLALARSPEHTAGALLEAADVADRSGDFNLVTAVAKAARAAGRPLDPKVF